MLNYSVQAIEFFMRFMSGMLNGPFSTTRQEFQEIISLLSNAVKFKLPDNGIVIDKIKALQLIDHRLLRLPFPVVALEYRYTDESNIGEKCFAAPKRISLCLDFNLNPGLLLTERAAQICPSLLTSGGILIVSIFFTEEMWCMPSFGCIVPCEDVENNALLYKIVSKENRQNLSRIGMMPLRVIDEGCNFSIKEDGAERAIHAGLRDVYDEAIACITMLAALSCKIIGFQDIPASEKLNKMRILSGKIPFQSCNKVVFVSPGKEC